MALLILGLSLAGIAVLSLRASHKSRGEAAASDDGHGLRASGRSRAAAGATAPPAGRAPKAPTKLPRYEQLDAFRLIVITVVVFHTYQHSRGPSGFVLQLGTLSDSIVRNLDWLLSFYFIHDRLRDRGAADAHGDRGPFAPGAAGLPRQATRRLVPLYLLVFLIVWELRYAGTERQWNDLLWASR